MRSLNLDYLKAFADVVELGSFSGAAARLHLSQPAVSIQIKQLEQYLGVTLIERIGKKAKPTMAGQLLLSHIRSINTAVYATIDAMAPHTQGVAGRVRLAAGATACIYLLAKPLRDLRERYPDLDIVVSTGNTPSLIRDIEDNKVDAGLLALPAESTQLQVTPLVDDEIVLISSRDHDRLPGPLTPKALSTVPIVLYESGASTREIIDGWFSEASFDITPAMELGNVEAIKSVVTAGLGFGLIPRMAIKRVATDNMQIRSLSPRLYRQLGIVTRKDKFLSPALRAVSQALHDLRTITAN